MSPAASTASEAASETLSAASCMLAGASSLLPHAASKRAELSSSSKIEIRCVMFLSIRIVWLCTQLRETASTPLAWFPVISTGIPLSP
jgi:hypothetical protein